jgi:hypothetical protein
LYRKQRTKENKRIKNPSIPILLKKDIIYQYRQILYYIYRVECKRRVIIVLDVETYTEIRSMEAKGYDCLECGQKTSVLERDGYGTCQTPGCLYHNPIQFVYYPHWLEPKISRAGRTILFL